uniref:Uncharacterized protein n=1 Tax=Octopus bimaculoides TaxID=37653 RepID=A0A0L8H9M3_OCTBM
MLMLTSMLTNKVVPFIRSHSLSSITNKYLCRCLHRTNVFEAGMSCSTYFYH